MLGWGINAHGQLGLGPAAVTNFIPTPQRIPFFNDYACIQVACSLTHSIFLLNDGSVYTAGSNEYSQLGREGRTSVPEKVILPQHAEVVQVACGQHFSVCLTSNGKVVIWGSISGKVTNDDGFFYQKPEYLGGFTDKRMIQIAAGYNHCLGLTDDGTVYATGINTHGQLGLGHNHDCVRATPIVCLRGSPIVFIACGAYHSLIISKSGTVFTCGFNLSGQLGLGDTDPRVWPSNVKSLQQQKATYASCGEKHSAVITLEGGVFSFGSSAHGQLGHNSTNDELLPRKISELMGSEVSQIACGRSHTVIFMPNIGQISTFGLACAGRIDTKLTTFASIPQKLVMPFLPYKTMKQLNRQISTDRNPTTSYRKFKSGDTKPVQTNLQVIGIYSGGNQIFVRVSSRAHRPDDYRIYSASHPLLELNLDFAKWLCNVPQSSDTLKDVERKLSRLFNTEACLNGSFLSLPDTHFRTSSSNPGIDLDQVITVMEKLRSCDPKVQQLLFEHIQSILLTLPETAPCFEALRIYLILPFCHIFENEESFETVSAPFAQAATRLKKTADGRVLDYWILHIGRKFVQRIIELYKPLVVKIIQINSMGSTLAAEQYQTVLEAVLELLKKVHNVSCNMAKPELVRHDAFYMKELNDMIDIKRDYDFWQARRYLVVEKKIVSFCDYPFLFDLKAKILLLQYHGQLEMQEAIRNAFMHNFQTMMGARVETVNPLLMLHVHRNTIVQDTIAQLDKYKDDDFKKPLQVYFHNEEGLDAGGIRKEFFLLLTKEILNPKYGMFTVYEETNTIWFSDYYDEEEEAMYKLIGTLCALAVYNITIIDLPFPLALYKKLLNKTKIDLEDMKSVSPTVYQSLRSLLNYKEDDLETALCYAFDIEREIYGERRRTELKPGGSSIMVNQKNKHEFVELYIDYIFNKSCEKQYQAFSAGFRRVINSKPLELFYPDELMAFVIGNTNYDWNEFQKKTEYKGEYHANHPVIQWFWQVFHKLGENEKKKFLLFLTGSDRVPVFGWSQTLPMTIQRSHTDDAHLPVSHTCFNILDMPLYSSKEILKAKLLEAIQHNQGFNLV
ncbi:unnamed protein product [Rotaria socialis]|uniref:HECT domain-containing protein n=3 Tax=Rotaria socialis TaxID=392032 RepID=A0A817X4C9_9BILA|nr:unnamed protein product [Rotaria socialis]CAF3362871.1 unnamed protein product [Rotaria socialis]CAF3371207.1 unnamed protein product [Rotaria socialis]CAF3457263.1 unnamed protein product [Rotaria socialis]CAF4547908.1 unnamed protein product [Rotaria socialis]